MSITSISTSGGSIRVLAASNNRSSIVFTTGVKKESSGYSE
jgi:hypothetical protein